jgi:hypothetical protein
MDPEMKRMVSMSIEVFVTVISEKLKKSLMVCKGIGLHLEGRSI